MISKKRNHHVFLFGVLVIIISLVIGININYILQNPFANYERIVDFYKHTNKQINNFPEMALVFYKEKVENKNSLSTYLRHFDNYRKQKIKMIILNDNLSEEYQKFLRNFNEEFLQYSDYSQALLIHDNNENIGDFVKFVEQFWNIKEIDVSDFSDQDIVVEEKIDNYMQAEEGIIIMLSDLNSLIEPKHRNVLIDEAIYFSQKYSLIVNVADALDTKISNIDPNYSSLIDDQLLSDNQAETQKKSVQIYADKYGSDLVTYMKQKLINKKAIQLSDKHLRDRGNVYVELTFKQNNKQHSLKAFRENSGIITALNEISDQFLLQANNLELINLKIYLLTEPEYIEKPHQMLQPGFLSSDDGVWVKYGHLKGLIIADQRLAAQDYWLKELHQAAGIPELVVAEDVKYYKFKAVEIEYENQWF